MTYHMTYYLTYHVTYHVTYHWHITWHIMWHITWHIKWHISNKFIKICKYFWLLVIFLQRSYTKLFSNLKVQFSNMSPNSFLTHVQMWETKLIHFFVWNFKKYFKSQMRSTFLSEISKIITWHSPSRRKTKSFKISCGSCLSCNC